MDRREFLTSTSLAAAATATTATGLAAAEAAIATPATEASLSAPHLASRSRSLVLSVAQSIDTLEIGTAARRFAHRLETALGDGTKVSVSPSGSSAIEAVTSAEADLAIGLESHHATYHPAFRLLAGLPIGEHLSPLEQQAWMTVGGGRELWDELAAAYAVKSLAIGHTGISAGLYAEHILETPDDLRGLRIACRGLARDVVASLGGIPVGISEAELAGGLSALGLDAAEPLGMPSAAVAHWSYQPGLLPGGMMLSLTMRDGFWYKLGASGQAVLEGLAAEAHGHSLAVAMSNQAMLRQVQAMRRWPVSTGTPSALSAALEQAGTAAVDAVAGYDALANRMVASLRRFRDGIVGRDSYLIG